MCYLHVCTKVLSLCPCKPKSKGAWVMNPNFYRHDIIGVYIFLDILTLKLWLKKHWQFYNAD